MNDGSSRGVMQLEGRARLVCDAEGRLIDDIDTDAIYPNAQLGVTRPEEMAPHAFGNLEGFTGFPETARAGDILFVGRNFGAGSSRQHAVQCFTALGVRALVGVSFAPIYRRNAINAALALLECPDLEPGAWREGERVRVELLEGRVTSLERGHRVVCRPPSAVQLDIYRAGGLFAYGRTVRSESA